MKPASILSKIKECRALVVGDICLDRWCVYDPRESDISRETGIPRVGIVKAETTPGAGGTVANNLASLGAGRVAVLGAIGQDGFGFELERGLAAQGIDYRLLVASPEIQTFTYTKVINARTGKEDRPRLDFINNQPLPGDVEDQLIANFHRAFPKFDVILVSDQSETEIGGVISDALREVIADVAERYPGKIVMADSRTRIERFRNTIPKANRQEAIAACKKLFGRIDYPRLRAAIGEHPLVVTEGSRGALLIENGSKKRVAAVPVGKPVDRCGAGDAFGAGMALALWATGDYEEAVRFGSLVSGVTIMKKGTGTASPAEVVKMARSRPNGKHGQ
jgi:rfaE bifunctional protein kinase chain/domain